MKKLMFAAVAAFSAAVANAALVEDAAGLSEAVSAAESGDTIKLKADAVIELTTKIALPNNKALTISGGWTDESTRVPGKMSTLSGDGTLETLMSVANAADCPVALEHLVFTKAMRHAFQKSGGDGDLAVTDCAFKDNVTTSVYGGIALQLLGTANASLAIDGCTFDNNVTASHGTDLKKDDNYGKNGGLAVRISKFKQVTITDSTFTRNGVPFDHQVTYSKIGDAAGLGYWNEAWGSTMFVQDAPVAMSGCEFRANRGATAGAVATGGGIVHLRGAGDGTTIDHCLFVGNEEVHGRADTSGPKYGYGALVVGLNAGCTATIDHTTIAYNLSDTVESAAGLTVYTGTAVVRNSIIFGNTMWATANGGADLTVNAGALADVDATLFTANDAAHVLDAAGNGLTRRGGVMYGDPQFATAFDAALAPVQVGTSGRRYFDFDDLDAVLGFDVHLRSKQGSRRNGSAEWTLDAVNSPALDAGETTADYSNEPTPNGNRLNLGRYGNTDEASKSVAVKPEIESVDVAFPDNKSKPFVTVKLAEVDDGDYNADVTITFGTTSEDRIENVFPGVHPGATLEAAKSAYFTPGADLSVLVKVTAAGFEDVVYETTVKVTGEISPYVDHGGGAHVVHLRADADGAGTGANWLDAFTDLKAALAALGGEKTELWIASTVVASAAPGTLSPDVPILIRGGFTGLEDDAEERPAGRRSVLSGNGGACDLVLFNNGADKTVSFERLEFREGAVHAVRKSGGDGDVVFDDCVFADNVVGERVGGAALQLLGTANAAATIRNCTFVNNATTSQETDPTKDDGYGVNGGLAVRICRFGQVTIADSTFTRNGIPFDFQVGAGGYHTGNGLGYWNVIYGSTLLVQDAPVAMSGCAFRANRGATSGSANGGGGIVHLRGAGDGTTIDHCLFVGNEEVHGNQNIAKPVDSYGALVIGLNKDSEATIDHTTIAYNTSDTAGSAAGLTVFSGKAVVRNSIVFGNSLNASSTGGADLTVFTDGQADVDYTLFSANDQSRVRDASAGGLVLRGGVIYGDPLFVTTPDEFLAPVVTGPGERRHFDFAALDTVLGFDVHLRSKKGSRRNGSAEWTLDDVDSPALDTGDPTADYANETEPNGKCLNLGVYGNTAEASRSEVATPELDAVEIVFADGYSRPDVTVSLVEDAGASYSATVKVSCGTGDVATAGWQYEKSVSGVHAGDVLPFEVTSYFTKDDTLTVRVEVSVPGIDPIVREIPRKVEGEYPPWFGKGGPANVLHVWSGAKGRGTGENWTDACTDLVSAFAAVRDGKDEIWVAGTNVSSLAVATFKPAVSFLLRGGFAGVECAATERAEGAWSVLSGQGLYDLVSLSIPEGVVVTVEDLEFRECVLHAFRANGAGELVLRRCRFADNVVDSRYGGCGLQAYGLGAVTIEDCVFDNNVTTSTTTDPSCDDYGSYSSCLNGGSAARLGMLGRATVLRSTFTRNGVPFDYRTNANGSQGYGNGLGYWNPYCGSTLLAQDSNLTMCGCEFRANRGTTPAAWGGGAGIVYVYHYLTRPVVNAAISNCLFVANEELNGKSPVQTGGKVTGACGALVVDLVDGTADVVNCTFAYNLSVSDRAASGLTVGAGTATVRSSLFYGNTGYSLCSGGADLAVMGTGAADVAWSLFTDDTTNSVTGVETLTGCVFGDPLLVTDYVTSTNCLATESGNLNYETNRVDDVIGFNAHLRGMYGYTDEKTGELVKFPKTMSPAIDAGDPTGPWQSEPKPNGRRTNIGAYGNTPYATRSQLKGLMLMVR